MVIYVCSADADAEYGDGDGVVLTDGFVFTIVRFDGIIFVGVITRDIDVKVLLL